MSLLSDAYAVAINMPPVTPDGYVANINVVSLRRGEPVYGVDGSRVRYTRDQNEYLLDVVYVGDGVNELVEWLRQWPKSDPRLYLRGGTVDATAEKKAREQLRREKRALEEQLRAAKAELESMRRQFEPVKRENEVLRAGLVRRLPEHSTAFPRVLTRFNFLEIDPDVPVRREV